MRSILLALIPALILSSCCSIVNGTSQQVKIVSTPPNAKIFVDGKQQDFTTPTSITVERSKKPHSIRLEAPGYQPLEVLWPSHLSAWSMGNFAYIVWFWVADIVDFSTGAIWYYDDMTATLAPLPAKR